jgi:hypothetical protein
MMEVHEFKSFRPSFSDDFTRADLEIYGIDHFRPSYTGLIFFNAGNINPKTIDPSDPRCAGSFSIFGHSKCVGDEGHCHPHVPQRFDPRRSDPLTRAFKRVTVTTALKAALATRKTLQVTIVVSDGAGAKHVKQSGKKSKAEERPQLFACNGLQIATFV